MTIVQEQFLENESGASEEPFLNFRKTLLSKPPRRRIRRLREDLADWCFWILLMLLYLLAAPTGF